MTRDAKHVKYDECQRIHPRQAVAEAAYFGCAIVKNNQQGVVKVLVGARTTWKNVCESRTSTRSKIGRSRIVSEGVANTIRKHSSLL